LERLTAEALESLAEIAAALPAFAPHAVEEEAAPADKVIVNQLLEVCCCLTVIWLLLLLLLTVGACECKSWLGMSPKYIQNPDPAQRRIPPMVPACR
jgi:hypothetical protein